MLKSLKERMDNISGRKGGDQFSPQAPVISTVMPLVLVMRSAPFAWICLFTVLFNI